MDATEDETDKQVDPRQGERQDSGGEAEPIVIRKYANRRLYNMAESSYVTLEDIAELVRDGAEFGVFDAKTGEDITTSVLLQIIVEEEASGTHLLPVGFLGELIRLYDDPNEAIVPDYLDAAMAALRENLETFRRHQIIDDATGFEQLVRVSMEAFEQSLGQTVEEAVNGDSPAGDVEAEISSSPIAPPSPAPAASEDDDIRKTLDALQEQLSAIQTQIERLGRRP